ncbi:MAG: hydrogenase maturation protease [Promethearchaeota archaeon]
MKELYKEILSKLNEAKKIVFMGIGEEKLTDDGVGPYIISELLSYSNYRVKFVNAGVDPMARINEIIDFSPTHLVILDTCTLSEPPGTVAIIERDLIYDSVPISTHTIPVHIVIDLIIDKLPDLNVFMIGFVPESLEGFKDLKLYKGGKIAFDELDENTDLPFFEINLTKEIQQAALQVIKIIKRLVNDLKTKPYIDK